MKTYHVTVRTLVHRVFEVKAGSEKLATDAFAFDPDAHVLKTEVEVASEVVGVDEANQ